MDGQTGHKQERRTDLLQSSTENFPIELSQKMVSVVCKDNKIICRKRSSLAAMSNYFRVLLFGNYCEKLQDSINLNYVDHKLLGRILDFYDKKRSKTIKQTNTNISSDYETTWQLIEIADMLGFEEAANECDKHIIANLELKSCLDICIRSTELSRCLVCQEAVRKWILQRKFADHTVCRCLKPSGASLCMCTFARQYRKTSTLYVFSECYNQPTSECYRFPAEALLADSDSLTAGDTVNSFRKTGDYIPCYYDEHRMVTLETDIYITGGFDLNSKVATAKVWKYTTRKQKWCRVADMRGARFCHCVVSVGSNIYTCGGFDENLVLDSLEKYQPYDNQWIDLAKMPTGVGDAACASDEYGIFVVCGQYGYQGFETSNQIQYYLISTNQWTFLTTYDSPVFFPHSEYGLSCTVLAGKIVVFGGQTSRCDAYDIDNDSWERLADSHCRRMNVAAFTHQGKIVAGGYDDKTDQYHDTIEEYNMKKDEWRIVSLKLPSATRSTGFCMILDVEKIK